MIELENQRTGKRSEHATLNAAKHKATAQRRQNPNYDRFVIYTPGEVYLAKPGTKPRGRMARKGVKVEEMPLVWTLVWTADSQLTESCENRSSTK
jgi:hypothetical protein